MSTAEPAEGAIILPKRAPLWAALSLVAGVVAGGGTQLVTASSWGASYVAKTDSRFEALADSDARQAKRSDERYALVVERLVSLERDRGDMAGRLIRLEEQSKMTYEVVREIRESMRAPPRR